MLARLAQLLPAGTTVYYHVDRLKKRNYGWAKHCSFFAIINGEIDNITGMLAVSLGLSRDHKDGGVTCDYPADIVETLASKLFTQADAEALCDVKPEQFRIDHIIQARTGEKRRHIVTTDCLSKREI